MQWNYRQIRRRSWDTAFKKGKKAWFAMVMTAFLFAFIGVTNSSQTTFIDSIDNAIGANDPLLPGNVDMLKEYIEDTEVFKKLPFLTSDTVSTVMDSASKGATWILKLLAANLAYFQRNKGEVVAILLISAIIAAFVKFFIMNVLIVGLDRYVMEYRFSKKVSIKRTVAPFHKETLGNTIKVMFVYKMVTALWWVTIIGGVYKYYQYYFVPYLLAENPSITWKEAKKLSSQMTKGYKWKMFLTQASYIYIWILKAFPLIGLLVAVPVEMTLGAEFYFTLRANVDSDLFIEPVFSNLPYVEKIKAKSVATDKKQDQGKNPEGEVDEPVYVLSDLEFTRPEVFDQKSEYSFTDFIFMFFIFSLIGWLWECGLYIVRDHMLVNRGTLYGPWIPIYGAGGVLMIFLLDRFKSNKLKLVVMEVVVCGILEYLTSFVLDFNFNSTYWDYKDMSFNLNGRICVAGLTAFALGGLAGIYLVAPALAGFVGKYPKKKQRIAAAILCAAFVIDIICCLIFGFNAGEGVGGNL